MDSAHHPERDHITSFRQTSRKDVFFVSTNSNAYEHFRTVLIMNLASAVSAEQLPAVLEAIDVTMSDFEISQKPMSIITIEGTPDVVKYYIGSKAIAGRSVKTLNQYRYKLVNFFDTVRKPYTDITSNDIRMYLYQYKVEHHASDCYMDNIRTTLDGFFTWLADNDYIPKNPCAKVDHIKFQRKKREPLSSFDLEVYRWNTTDVREKALIDFFFSTGIRVSECADVRLSDIDWDNRSVHIRHGKGDKERTVYFNAESELSLKEYLKTRNDKTDALFVSTRAPHHPIKSHALENILKNVSKRSGLNVFPHRLRHTFATAGLRGGMPIEHLQRLLGHEDPKTTLIYAKLDQVDLQRDHQRVYS